MKEKSSRNQTIEITEKDEQELKPLLITKNNIEDNDLINKTINGDTLEMLKYIPDDFADLIIIDPPYNLSKKYNGITIEFENMYRAADDIQRHTKQNIEIYTVGDPTTATTGLIAKLEKALGITIEKVEYKKTAE